METQSAWRALGVMLAQLVLAWFAVLILFGVAVFGDGGEYDGLIGFLIVPTVVNAFALAVGLPLRLIPITRRFLRRHGELAIGVALVGLSLVLIGKATTNGWLIVAGLVSAAIGAVHAWPPFGWIWDEEARLGRKIALGRAIRGNVRP